MFWAMVLGSEMLMDNDIEGTLDILPIVSTKKDGSWSYGDNEIEIDIEWGEREVEGGRDAERESEGERLRVRE